jgi:hypothetical protein
MKVAARRFSAIAIAVSALLAAARNAESQQAASLLRLEVTDTVGIPLPDARLEVFTLLEGGINWEWARVLPEGIPAGTYLLRISNPGYEPAVFSVPLRKDSHVALRVRLTAPIDSASVKAPIASAVRAQGFAIDGRIRTDVIGNRRIVDHRSATMTNPRTLGDLLHRVRGTTLTMYPASDGTFSPRKARPSRRMHPWCSTPVMLNGDRRKVLTFDAANQLLAPEEIEALEIFEAPGVIPSAYTVSGGDYCGGSMLVAWMKT